MAAGIDSAAALARVSDAWAREMLGGVVGARLVRELQGYSYAGLHPSEDDTLARKSITCSRTFGRPLTAYADMQGAVTSFLSRAAEKLRAQGDQAYVLTVYVQQNRFDPHAPPPYSRSATLTLPSGPSADTRVLAQYAQHLLGRLWEPGTVYHKAGLCSTAWSHPAPASSSAYLRARWPAPCPWPQLMATLVGFNARYGRGTVQLGSAVPPRPTGGRPPWQGQAQWHSGAFTTRLEDLLMVN